MGVLDRPVAAVRGFRGAREEIAAVERGGADLLHVDVMDGHFVPNLSIGPPVVRAIKRVATVPLDVHLMLDNPDEYMTAFVDAGASRITVHVEVLPHLHRTLQVIRSAGVKAGVAHQSVDAGGRARGNGRRRRSGAGHVGQPRLWRPDFHPAQRV